MEPWLIYKVVDLVTPLCVDERNEQLGLDLSQHGENYGIFVVKGPGTLTSVFDDIFAI